MTKIYGFAGTFFNKKISEDNFGFKNEKVTILEIPKSQKLKSIHAGLGQSGKQDQPVFFQESGNYGVFCGHFLNCNFSDILFSLTKKHINKIGETNGLFSAAFYNKENQTLKLITDRYGFRPVYYYFNKKENYFIFSSDINDLSENVFVKKQINWDAWANFFNLGYNLGNETGFKDILLVPPGSILTFKNGMIYFEKYWNISDIEVKKNMKYCEAVDGCADLFIQSIKRRNIDTKNNKAVFLSGGFDSRLIAAELKNQGAVFQTYTTRGFTPIDEERERARKISEALGVRNTFVNLPVNNFFKDFWKRANYLTGYETCLHQWILPLVDSIPENININYDGIGGDIITKGYISASGFTEKDFEKEPELEQFSIKILNNKVNKNNFLNKKILKRMGEFSVVDSIKNELSNYKKTENMITCFYLMNRTRRSIALSPFKVIAYKGIESFCPYMDNDFFDFAMSIPVKLKLKNNLRKDIMKKICPALESVSTTNYKIKKRNQYYPNDINYYTQKREHLRHNIYEHYIKNNWIFSNTKTFPRVLKEISLSLKKNDWPTTVFTTSCLVFYEWLEKYFHDKKID
jgi:asparagine synthetase B (glutamine-hydrolysing)